MLPDIVDSLTIDAAGGDSDEKEKATNPWRGRLPATRTEYYHWGLLQARGRPGELWITRRDSQMSGSTRACKEYGTAVSPYVVGFDRTLANCARNTNGATVACAASEKPAGMTPP